MNAHGPSGPPWAFAISIPAPFRAHRHETMLAMKAIARITIGLGVFTGFFSGGLSDAAAKAQPSAAVIIRQVDAAVEARVENVTAFTDIEHYAVFRGTDETHPAAQMTVKDTYRKGLGKTYTVLSQSGSEVVRKFGLEPLLQHEQEINEPGKVDNSWFTSANYNMKLKSSGTEQIDGRACYSLAITPRYKAPNMIDGTLWVDARDFSIVEVKGIASRRPSVFAGTTHMMRQYKNIDGYSMATHARAESDSWLVGRTVVLIDYSEYHLKLRSPR